MQLRFTIERAALQPIFPKENIPHGPAPCQSLRQASLIAAVLRCRHASRYEGRNATNPVTEPVTPKLIAPSALLEAENEVLRSEVLSEANGALAIAATAASIFRNRLLEFEQSCGAGAIGRLGSSSAS